MGDILFLHMSNDPIRAGEIVVYNIKGRSIPIVHRVVEVHQRQATGELDILTKGDNNREDDRTGLLYSPGQLWLQQHHIMGRAVGFLPYVGYFTIIMTDMPILKVCFCCPICSDWFLGIAGHYIKGVENLLGSLNGGLDK
ncbi:hypothetical protein M5K25_009610 [Dendrobium thyrsiflorum]|uniref:Signal peptidase complex catalytic subunit SEC11 n=1 Tax=Dendrobium thyrsiflorum TaxID=117978 RepID=A0ABD0VCZ2_DENTH